MSSIATKKKKGAKVNKGNSTAKRPRVLPSKSCMSCPSGAEEQPSSSFYVSYNPLHSDGRVPMCKTCMFEQCYDVNLDEINIDKLKSVLRQIDRPWVSSLWESATKQCAKVYKDQPTKAEHKRSLLAYYFKNLSLPQYRALSWNEGLDIEVRQMQEQRVGLAISERGTTSLANSPLSKETNRFYLGDADEYIPSEEVIKLFGEGYEAAAYQLMEQKYNELKAGYTNFTPFHAESLKSYVRLKAQEELATIRGEFKAAASWNESATRAAKDAKLNPSQLSKNDLEGGMSSFSELFQAVEQAVDVIPILPKFRQRPNDIIDFNIWCYIDYARELEGKPRISYEEVYQFYDERKTEYIARTGDPGDIFANDDNAHRRGAVKQFITLPADYYSDQDKDNGEGGD